MNNNQNISTVEQAQEMGLLPDEFDRIKEILGRTPNFCELSIFGVMWSEHCSYKNSIIWLKKLPKDGPHMLVEAGEEMEETQAGEEEIPAGEEEVEVVEAGEEMEETTEDAGSGEESSAVETVDPDPAPEAGEEMPG